MTNYFVFLLRNLVKNFYLVPIGFQNWDSMHVFIVILIVIISVLLVFTVVVQSSKGGGLASSFASANKVMGVRRTTDFFETFTWYLIGALVFFCVFANFFAPDYCNSSKDSIIKDDIMKTINCHNENSIPSSFDNLSTYI